MNYVKEEMKLLNMKKVRVYQSNPHLRNGHTVFEIEKELSIDEKVSFIDSQLDGIATYLIELFTKWDSEKDSLPQGQNRTPKMVSKKAWIRKNDTRGILNNDYSVGSYSLFGTGHRRMELVCPATEYGYSLAYTGKHIAEQWFHDLLEKLYREEKKHFADNDPFTIKLNKVKELGDRYGIFHSKEINDIVWNSKKDVKEANLDAYIKAYEKLKKATNEIEAELHNTLDIEKIEEDGE